MLCLLFTQDKEYDEKVDIYAIGVLAFFLLTLTLTLTLTLRR